MKLVTFCLALLAICFQPCKAQITLTGGFSNGYLWGKLDQSDKLLYVVGLTEGVTLQAATVAARSGSSHPDESLLAKNVLINDIVAQIDAFYSDRANMRVAVMWSYTYAMRKIKGATPPELQDLVARMRRNANR